MRFTIGERIIPVQDYPLNRALTMHPANFACSQQGFAVAVSDLPLVAMLKTRMHWHQTRQKLLAENVSNADTPGFQPKDLKAPAFRPDGTAAATAVAIGRTDPRHIAAREARGGEDPTGARRFETTPSGNAVSLEDEMLKVSQNQSDFQLAASLYQKSLQMLRVAAGKR
jgi:flagellar basal-body rod protein FlgB